MGERAGLDGAAILDILNRKRDKLGINKKAQRKMYDMKDRRALNV